MERVTSGLVTPSHSHRFTVDAPGAGQVELEDCLRKTGSDTLVVIRSADALMLTPEAKTLAGFSYTPFAFGEVCSRLASNLSSFLYDLSGSATTRSTRRPQLTPDMQQAIRIFNDMVRLRFSAFRGWRMVLDPVAKSIEGIVGTRYCFLPNLDFYQMCCEHMYQGSEYMFSEAMLTGRRFMLRFRAMDRAFALPTPGAVYEPFYYGRHFYNSESGDAAVNMSAYAQRRWGNSCSLSTRDTANQVHHLSRVEFDKRLVKLFEGVAGLDTKLTPLYGALLQSKRSPLGIYDACGNRTRLCGTLLRDMYRHRVFAQAAERVIRMAVVQGSYKADATNESCSTRVVYDLYTALTTVAKDEPLEDRLAMEQLAHRLVCDNILGLLKGATSGKSS